MIALYDSTGTVRAWLHRAGRIYTLSGQNLAFVKEDSVYDWKGQHIAWWEDGHVRDSVGAVAYFTTRAKDLGGLSPFRQLVPIKPLLVTSPLKPRLALKPLKPRKRAAWSNNLPF